MTLLLILLAACSSGDGAASAAAADGTVPDTGGADAGGTGNDGLAAAYVEDFAEAVCDWYLACIDPDLLAERGITDVESCVEVYRGVGTNADESDCEFHPDQAAACLAEIERWTCEDVIEGGVETPAVCDEVCGE